MDYQIIIKQTHEDNNDTDHFFPLTRAQDVKLTNITSDPDLDLPKNDDTLDYALARYNDLFKGVDEQIDNIAEDIETIRNNRSEMEDVVRFNSKAIEQLQDDIVRSEIEMNNIKNSVGKASTDTAENKISIQNNSLEISKLKLKTTNNEKSIDSLRTDTNLKFEEIEGKIESLEGNGGSGENSDTFTEITEEQIREVFKQSSNK